MDEFQVELVGDAAPDAVTKGDMAELGAILESWTAQPGTGNAIAERRPTAIDVLTGLPWDWSGAAPVGVWGVLALALRTSRWRPAWIWTLRDDARGTRSWLVDELLQTRVRRGIGAVVLRAGRVAGPDAVRPGVRWPLTCSLLHEVEGTVALCRWIGVDPEEESNAMRRAVEDTIREAFATARYPGDAATESFWPETTAYFRGRHWNGNAVSDLRTHEEAMSYMPPQGFCYFLPAFMLAELEDPPVADVIAHSIAFHLDPVHSPGFAEERVALLTPEQRVAVVGFLDYLEGSYGGRDTDAAVCLLESGQSGNT